MNTKGKVLVAMSGGVDSSVAAAMLLHQGYEVIGATMKLWDSDPVPASDDERGCCSLSAVEDARRVSAILNIPHYVLNFRDMFEDKVISYFIDEYAKGRTPNPCIACNREIKFDGLMQKARALDADWIATGHYACIVFDGTDNSYSLLKGTDPKKDQSYVLYHLTQETLQHFLLPLGGMAKTQIRQLAHDWKLPIADKPDSQDICFIPDNNYRRFLQDKRPSCLNPGNFVSVTGEILGRHQGTPCYTIGQRKNLGIALGRPMFVVGFDMEKNLVILGDSHNLFATNLIAEDVSWINPVKMSDKFRASAKIRYSATESPAEIEQLSRSKLLVRFDEPQRAITPGQSIVFYDGLKVLGGAVIETVFPASR